MSCDIAAAGILWLASLSGGSDGQVTLLPALSASASQSSSRLAAEPLYADIVGRAQGLKAKVEAFRKSASAAPPRLDDFKDQIQALSGLDMKGHLDLAARGTDGDLKCILKGISQDLPRKLADLTAASTPKERIAALDEMFYLLRDNVEVITTPPSPPV